GAGGPGWVVPPLGDAQVPPHPGGEAVALDPKTVVEAEPHPGPQGPGRRFVFLPGGEYALVRGDFHRPGRQGAEDEVAAGDGDLAVEIDGLGAEGQAQVRRQSYPGIGAIHRQYVLAPQRKGAGVPQAGAVELEGARLAPFGPKAGHSAGELPLAVPVDG